MLSIQSKPPDVIFSGNPAWFSVEQSPDGPRQIRATLKDGATEVGSFYSFASSQNIAHFELSELIESVVNSRFSLTPEEEIIERQIFTKILSHTIKTFSVTFSDNSHETSCSFTVIKGKITPDLYSLIGYGYEYESISQYLLNNPVLSIKPKDIYVHHPDQPERIYLYLKEEMSISVEVTAHLPGGVISESIATFSATANSIYYINTSYESIIPELSIKHVSHCSFYRIRLYSGAYPITPWYDHYVNFSTKSKGCFVFQNSLGGYDTLPTTGNLSLRSTRAHDASQVAQNPFLKQNTSVISNIKTSSLYTQNTGMLPSSYAHFIQQLLYSPKAYWLPFGESPMEITIDQANINISKTPGELVSAQIPFFFNPKLKAEQQ